MRAAAWRRLALPLRIQVVRFAAGLLIGASILLMALDQIGNPVIEAVRVRVADTLAPLLDALGRPVVAARGAIEEAESFIGVWHENARLRDENASLVQWREAARRLAAENEALRALARVVPDARASFVTARVVATSGGSFVHTLLIGAGAEQGVDIGQGVIAPAGLVGRIVEIGTDTSRVLLLTDLNSRVPVRLESSRDRAILAGDNSRRLRLQFLPEQAVVMVGDRVVTSGEGGLIPPGVPAGVVTEWTDGVALVRPLVDAQRLEFVTVLDYTVPGALPETREAGPLAPPW